MANPDPEITAEEVAAVRDDAIMATGPLGLSQPGQQRARLSLHLPRRARRARHRHQHGDEDRRGAARSPSSRARTCPDEVAAAYGARPKFGPDYIIPVPFDPRLISYVPPAVAKAAMDTGVARKPIVDMDAYRAAIALAARSDRRHAGAGVQRGCAAQPKRVVFAEGEEEQVIRAAASFVQQGLGTALLVGREDRVQPAAREAGIELGEGIEIINARLSTRNADLYQLISMSDCSGAAT